MILRHSFKILLFVLLLLNLPNLSISQILQRGNSNIPLEIEKKLQNQYRKLINLNGEWNLRSSEEGITKNITVPFCYEFKGKVNCKRDFNIDIENISQWNFILVCDGVNYSSEFIINGSFVMKHEGGYTQFSALIPDGIIKESGNTIEVTIDNSLDFSKTLPTKPGINTPKIYGGIYRDVYIIAVSKLFVKNINIISEIDINFNADIKTQISLTATDLSYVTSQSEAEKKFSVKTTILDTSGTIISEGSISSFNIANNSTIQIHNNLSMSGVLFWTPENPKMYFVKVQIYENEENIIDEYITDFGVNEIKLKNGVFSNNDMEFKLKGINFVEDIPGKGLACTYEELERDVKNIKTLGCNAVKVHGRPASTYLINLCNQYGLFILEELPIYNLPEEIFIAENFTALCENELIEMIINHKNNPSILAYGLGNDYNTSQETTKDFLIKLASIAKHYDKRLVYYSTRMMYNDICKDAVDIVGLNIYDKDLKEFKDFITDNKIRKDKLFLSNYGKIINPVNFAGYSDPTSIEAQSKYIVDINKLVRSSNLAGNFFFSYSDWNSDFPITKNFSINPYLVTTGIFTHNREARSSSAILKKIYWDEDLPNLNIGTFSKESPVIFILFGIVVFLIFVYLANSIRRFRENIWRALFRPFIFFTDVREQNLIQKTYNVILALILSIGNALFIGSILYFWRNNINFDIILSQVVPNENVKIIINNVISNPVRLTSLLAIFIFLKIFIFSVVIWLFSLTLKFRVPFNNIYTISSWSLLPTVLLGIAGTIYYRIIIENPDMVIIGLILTAIIYLICFYRMIKGTYIIFESPIIKTYFYAFLTIAIIIGGVWFYLDSTRFIGGYFRLIFAFIKN